MPVPGPARGLRDAGLGILAGGLAGLLLLAPPAHAAARAPSVAAGGMVVSSSDLAARAGASILAAGGNAVDAAVATAFAVAVTQPFSAGLGGGAFALVRDPEGKVFALDARETAPAAASRDMYLAEGLPERPSIRGPLAVAIPSFTAGMALMQARWGSLPLARVLEPAIALAEGFPLAGFQARRINAFEGRFDPARFPETARIQFAPAAGEGRAEVGDVFVQADLARTLRAIAKEGPGVIQGGRIGQAIAAEVQRRGGILSAADLAGYAPKLRAPVEGSYRGFDVYSFPPPSSGGAVLLQCLNVLEGFDLAASGPGSSASLHAVAEAMKLAFADRAAYMGDSDFVDVPVERLISREYADAQRARIDPAKAASVAAPGLPADDAGTAHLSVTDGRGGAVGITMTINTSYGSGITVPGTGIILNNEMDDFSLAPDTPNAYGLVDTRGANAIAPGKRPLSSMTPTLLVKDGKPFMLTGSPGGPRIISTVLLTILNVVDWGMDVQAAVSAPRYHHQWIPDSLRVEPETPADVVEALRARGHSVDVQSRHWSAAEAIVIDPVSGLHHGGSDPRTDGGAYGPR
ncbi:MAG: gamma-glutamyltransferase [Myxococcota bacterium]|nr:gamma-glutamyltransferase [Myxococcota bacterium]